MRVNKIKYHDQNVQTWQIIKYMYFVKAVLKYD